MQKFSPSLPSIDNPLPQFVQSPAPTVHIFLEPPIFENIFRHYYPSEAQDKHEMKLMRENYFSMYRKQKMFT